MRILYVITSLRRGGAEKLVAQLSMTMREREHSVDVALFDGVETTYKKELEQAGFKVFSFSEEGSVYSPKMLFKLLPLIKKYDIVHTHNASPQLYGALAKWLSFGGKTKLIYTEHNTTNRRRNMAWFRAIDRWAYNRYSKIICISEKAYTNLAEYLKGCKAEIVTIKNGADISALKAAAPNVELREGAGRYVIVMVAAFRPQKDQDTLIKALALLPKDYTLWLVGDGERRVELEALAENFEVAGRVKFWGVRDDVPTLLKSADVVAFSSHYEGLSLSSIEGMAVGKPFVASDVDGLREIVEGAGVLIKEGDAEGFAAQIKELCTNGEYARQIALACEARAAEYDFSKMAEEYNNLYMSLK